MKKRRGYLLFIFIALSCTQYEIAPDNEITATSERLRFNDVDSFLKTVDLLNKMNSYDLKSWESQHSTVSLRSHLQKKMQSGIELTDQENEFTNFPPSYLTLLNKEGEVEVDNQIWWFSQGEIHRASGEQELTRIKSTSSENKGADEYFITSVPLEPEQISTGAKVVITNTYANYQKEFAFCANNTLRKYVNELYVFTVRSGQNWSSSLHIRMKLEWKGSNGWKTAGEYRFINYDLAGYAKLITASSEKTNTGVWSSGGILNQNFMEDIFIQSGGGNYFSFWYEVELKGTIYQAISSKLPTGPGGSSCNPYTIGGTPDSIIW